MLRDEIIEMARKAGVSIRGHYDETGSTPTEIEVFAKLVAAKEREACAVLIDENANKCSKDSMAQMILFSNATAIRARGEA